MILQSRNPSIDISCLGLFDQIFFRKYLIAMKYFWYFSNFAPIVGEEQLPIFDKKILPFFDREQYDIDCTNSDRTIAVRDRRLSASWRTKWGPPWIPLDHTSTIVLRGLRESLIGPLLCQETAVSRTANVSVFGLGNNLSIERHELTRCSDESSEPYLLLSAYIWKCVNSGEYQWLVWMSRFW